MEPALHDSLRLPETVYTPGEGGAPDLEPLIQAKALVPERFGEGVPVDHPALQFGIKLHDKGFFWEAHEVLEAVWKAAPKNGRDRLALRAFIQLANAALKQRMGLKGACERLLGDALEALKELGSRSHDEAEVHSLAYAMDLNRLISDLEDRQHDLWANLSLSAYFFLRKVGAPSKGP